MTYHMKWIDMVELPKPENRKTKIFQVVTKDTNVVIGIIRWHGPWRKYAFFPYPDTVFEWFCLRDIAEFCQRETEKYKEDWYRA